ncbi:hypothetical protein [Paenibacillus daejeonensis]|uniref:hypothetical protein n=1 Tax=Paenibacillus daejeonensis TaxID=135193 RepID=UPI000373F7DD|nr:hypothetical protein [Paenibacillus daejeonensis]
MRKWLGRLLMLILVLIVLAGLGVWGALRYAAPQEELDLTAQPIRLDNKAQDLITSGELALELTESDVESLIKTQLQEDPQLAPDVLLTGARIELSTDRLIAHVNLKYRDQIPVGAVATYRLAWEHPNLVAIPEGLHIRSIRLPYTMLDTIRVPVAGQLPNFLEIGEVTFETDSIRFELESDVNLQDLLDLLP